eukprot:CAMPEP_0204835468 /NCGR_PEP_ID=MMETSP1346-20131115/22697_1 /ASSEMBLY_ACC=CAM_ASM_000771 /TAXON_ID=215587 /ORGANISM="Aplanochytrium stocchinoi, Strain GSBS06" /LENGTH=195 /DNA_ID=CAMNT_0051969513 /DNA_START=291 /DNA_END=878 /DNA_ORIENTATION=+
MVRLEETVVDFGRRVDSAIETVMNFCQLSEFYRMTYIYDQLDKVLEYTDGQFDLDFSQKINKRSQHSIFWFGVSTLVLGFVGLILPQFMLILLGAPFVPAGEKRPFFDFTYVFIRISAVAAVNMGAYYVFAALIDNSDFFLPTVPFRIFTFTIFSTLALSGAAPAGVFGIALWEGGGALWLAHALAAEARQNVSE